MFNKIVCGAEGISSVVGKCVAWLTLLMMLLTCLIVLLRYGLGIGSIALQESVLYMHAMVFMLGAAYTFNILGGLFFLLPFCAYTAYMSIDYVAASWRVLETSQEPGGLPFVYLLKTLIPIMMALLIIQGIADILKNLGVVFNKQQLTEAQ